MGYQDCAPRDARESKGPSNIDQSLDALTNAISRLDDYSGTLMGRLGTAMRPSSPSVAGNLRNAEKVNKSPLTERIDLCVERLGPIEGKLLEILDRLET